MGSEMCIRDRFRLFIVSRAVLVRLGSHGRALDRLNGLMLKYRRRRRRSFKIFGLSLRSVESRARLSIVYRKNGLIVLPDSLPRLRIINVFEINFWISLFKIILGNINLSEMFEFWKVPLYFIIVGVHAICGIRTYCL